MKRLLLIFALLSTLCMPVVVAGNAGAVDIFPNCGNGSVAGKPGVCTEAENPGNKNPIIHLLKVTIEILSLVIGAAAIIGIVLSGLRMILANGDSNAIASARSGLLYSLVGVAVTVLAQTIVIFVLDKVK